MHFVIFGLCGKHQTGPLGRKMDLGATLNVRMTLVVDFCRAGLKKIYN